MVIHNTFVIERVYPAEVSRVFGAFAEAGRKRGGSRAEAPLPPAAQGRGRGRFRERPG